MSGGQEVQDLPLPVLFQRAQRVVDNLDEQAESSQQGLRGLKEAEGWLRQCEVLVDSLGLFSPNEEVEDVTTADLKYLLVAGQHAEVQARTAGQETRARRLGLLRALESYARFMHLCGQYKLVPPEAQTEQPMDVQTRRRMKIERYRKEKAAKARLAQLRTAAQVTDLDEEGGDDDDEREREAWLTRVELGVLKAAEQIGRLKQEVEMLTHAASLPEGERTKPLPPPPADLLQKLHLAAGNLGGQRGQIAANVFRPSHILPTRTLRQQADIEVRQAQEAAESQAKADKRRAKLEEDEEYMLQKARAWDDWKDDNERGAGNSKLRPTA